jgi:hypothetical protein
MTLHPPLQTTIAPHATPAIAWIVQLPVHLPSQSALQCVFVPPIVVSHGPSHEPTHLPAQAAATLG